MKEYIVTCKTKEDLQSLYDDMETPGGDLYIPDREVEVAKRRPISRNTHYMLTDEEAESLRDDSRVLYVGLTPEELGITFHPAWTMTAEEASSDVEPEDSPNYTETSNRWSKTTNVQDNFRNWGIPRCLNGTTPDTGWGNDSGGGFTPNIFSNSTDVTCRVTSSGKNVDVVIVDGCIDPAHPEFQVNADGTGGSRVNQFNWLSLRAEVEGTSNGNYIYTPYIDSGSNLRTADNNHGCHVAGTAVGNRQGWARDANIYNINLYSSASTVLGSTLVFDYMRAWHNSKAINSDTGKRNPTIANNSWGSSYGFTLSLVSSINYRGTTINQPGGGWTQADLEEYGIVGYYLDGGTPKIQVPAFTPDLQADVDDCVADGIIFVAAAGNDSYRATVSTEPDYNNYLVYSGTNYYYHRGSQPAMLNSVISVGNGSEFANDRKSLSSTCGGRIDCYAPGSNIISSVHNAVVDSNGATATSAADSRDSSYRLSKYSGTSMASPQVCGYLANLLEIWPRMTPAEAIEYIKYGRSPGQISDAYLTPVFTVSASGSSAYVFSGSVTGNNASLSYTEGDLLTFNMSAGGHPFRIQTTNPSVVGGYDSANEVSEGLTVQDAGGRETGTVIWNTRNHTPGIYYYVCEYHQLMYGQITIADDYTRYESLQGSKNNYLNGENIRQVLPAAGSQNNIGSSENSSESTPRHNHKNRGYYSEFDPDAGSSGWVTKNVMSYPRVDVWHRGS